MRYSNVNDRYYFGQGPKIYDFEPLGVKIKSPPSIPSRPMQRGKEQDPHPMVERVQTRSPTITSNGGTSARKELTIVNKVNLEPQAPKPSGSPTKKKETSSDESLSPRFRIDVKSPPTPAMGILGPRPNSLEFERQKIERSKGVTDDIPRVEKGDDVLM